MLQAPIKAGKSYLSSNRFSFWRTTAPAPTLRQTRQRSATTTFQLLTWGHYRFLTHLLIPILPLDTDQHSPPQGRRAKSWFLGGGGQVLFCARHQDHSYNKVGQLFWLCLDKNIQHCNVYSVQTWKIPLGLLRSCGPLHHHLLVVSLFHCIIVIVTIKITF